MIKFFDLLLYKTRANLRSEISRLYLNYLWWALEPLFSMIVFYIVFGIFMNSSTPNFALFLLIGTTQWQWFSTTIEHMASSIYNSGPIMQQVKIPKIFFPLEVFLQDSFKHLFVITLMGIFIAFYPVPLTAAWISLPLIFLIQGILIIGLGMLCAALVPFLPDFRLILTTILNILFFISGIFFDVDMFVLPKHRAIMFANPMAGIIREYRRIILDGVWPDFQYLANVSLFAVVLLICGWLVLKRNDRLYPRLTKQ